MTEFRKYLVRQDNGMYTGYIMPTHYNNSLAAYGELFEEAKKTFPSLTTDAVMCSIVVRSSWCHLHPVIRFHVRLNKEPKGWHVTDTEPDFQLA